MLVSGIEFVVDPLPALSIPSLKVLVAAIDGAALDQGSLFGDSVAEDLLDQLRDALSRHDADRLILLLQRGELPDSFTRIASEVYILSDGGMQSLVLDDVGFGRATAAVVVQIGPFRDATGSVCTVSGSRITVPLARGRNEEPAPDGATVLRMET